MTPEQNYPLPNEEAADILAEHQDAISTEDDDALAHHDALRDEAAGADAIAAGEAQAALDRAELAAADTPDEAEAKTRALADARLAQLGYENTRQRLLTLAQDAANIPSALIDDAHNRNAMMLSRATLDPSIGRDVLDTLDMERRVYEALAKFKDDLDAVYNAITARRSIA